MSFDTTRLDLSPPVRRVAALGLLLIAVLAFVGLIVVPLVDTFVTAASNLAQQREAIARFQEVGARLPQLEAERAALQRSLAAEAGFLQGTSDALRAAEMQNHIKSVVESHGGVLASTQILPPREENGFRRVTAQATMTGSSDALLQILYDFEDREPYLFVDNLEIHIRTLPRLDNPRATKILLDIRVGLTGYAKPGAS
ncbi:MAG TPA: type II secretion system protein GspM [Stellaceae bacterium]|jgi:general secretion pathway protein M|nr:type II secretion system protein GspM [Stellaceae bacterium]